MILLLLVQHVIGVLASTNSCHCVGGKAYGAYCASWDASDEEPWCRVQGATACGTDQTFEASCGVHWSRVPCHGKGAPFSGLTRIGPCKPRLRTTPPCGKLDSSYGFVEFHTTKGNFTVQMRDDLAPRGAQQLREMVRYGYFSMISFFRVNEWITQFGVDELGARVVSEQVTSFPDSSKDANPCGSTRWAEGTFAMLGGVHMLIVINPNDHMGKNERDAPAGYVVQGMDVLRRLHRYNDAIDNPSGGPSPDQRTIQEPGGRAYLRKQFPKIDYITSARIINRLPIY